MVLGSDGPFLKSLNSPYVNHPASQYMALVLQPQSKYQTETPTERSCPNRALAVPASKANSIFVYPSLLVQRCLLASGQRSSTNRDHKHSARFISIYYKAFSCRIVGQKVQRVPVLAQSGMAGEAIDVCLLTLGPSPTHQHKSSAKYLVIRKQSSCH